MSHILSTGQVEAIFHDIEGVKAAQNNFLLPVIQSFQIENNRKPILSYVNKLLTTAASRENGFRYLNILIFCCPPEVLADNAITWVAHALGRNERASISSESLRFLANIIPLCNDIQDFNKSMMSSYLIKIIEMCISFQANNTQVALALLCLEICLQTYASTCIPMKNKIESFLVNFLSAEVNDFVVKRAGRCYNFLQQTGGAGPDGSNHIKNWSIGFEKLCSTIQNLYDKFLEDLTEFENYDRPSAIPIDLPSIPTESDSINVLTATENRLRNATVFLRAMLETKYPVAKVVIPKYVLDVVSRSLSLHMCIANGHNSSMSVQLNVLLMKHQIDSLYLLRSCMVALHSNLIPFSTMITKLLLDCLTRTTMCSCFNNNSKYKETIYKVLLHWITLLKNNMNTAAHEKLILMMLDDITPINTDVSLCINTNSNSDNSKKKAAKSKVLNSPMKVPSLKDYSKNSLDHKEKICCQALECLACFLKNIYISVKPNTLGRLYSTIIKSILKIQSGEIVFPYRNVNTELKLYEVLLAMIDRPSSIVPPPLEIAINIYVKGQKHSNHYIAQMCTSGLNILEKICQPVCPTLNLPVMEYECEREKRITEEVEIRQIVEVVTTTINEPERNEELNKVNDETALSIMDDEIVETNPPCIENLLNDRDTSAAVNDEVSENIETGDFASQDSLKPAESVQEETTVEAIGNSDVHLEEDSAFDMPQSKRAKYDEDSPRKDSDDDLMNSFVDVVYDY